MHVDDAPLPSVDLRAFRTAFHAIARAASATVIHNPRRNPSTECNFADALLQIGDDRVAVLLNCIYPLVAFAAESDLNGPPDFCDNATLSRAFADYPEFSVTSRSTLLQSVAPEMLAALAPAEIKQFNYWKPTRLGDVIFNYWD